MELNEKTPTDVKDIESEEIIEDSTVDTNDIELSQEDNENSSDNKEEVLKKHGQTVYDFLSKVKKVHVYETTSHNWGTDYEVVVETEEEDFSFSLMKGFPAESDVEYFSEDENDSVHAIFAEIPILWD